MHLQVRFQPRSSAPNVEKALDRLAKAKINLVGIGGSNVEDEGELAIAPQHGQEDDAMTALADYNPRTVNSRDKDSHLTVCIVDHKSGGLHACILDVAAANRERGWVIRDILIGVPDKAQHEAKKVPVQIYSDEPVSGSGSANG